jgi:hypothetical protein
MGQNVFREVRAYSFAKDPTIRRQATSPIHEKSLASRIPAENSKLRTPNRAYRDKIETT